MVEPFETTITVYITYKPLDFVCHVSAANITSHEHAFFFVVGRRTADAAALSTATAAILGPPFLREGRETLQEVQYLLTIRTNL